MPQQFSNAARGVLVDAIGPTDTAFNVTPMTNRWGSDMWPRVYALPTDPADMFYPGADWFYATIQEGDKLEVVRVYGTSDDPSSAGPDGVPVLMRAQRAQCGTTAQSFGAGATVGIRWLAEDAAQMRDRLMGVPTTPPWAGKLAACWGDGDPVKAWNAMQGHSALRSSDVGPGTTIRLGIPFTLQYDTMVRSLLWFGTSTLTRAFDVTLYEWSPRVDPVSESVVAYDAAAVNFSPMQVNTTTNNWGSTDLYFGGHKILRAGQPYLLLVGSVYAHTASALVSVGFRLQRNSPHTVRLDYLIGPYTRIPHTNGVAADGFLPTAIAMTPNTLGGTSPYMPAPAPAAAPTTWASFSAPMFLLA